MQFVLDVFGLALAVGSLGALRIYREVRTMRSEFKELLDELSDTTKRVGNLEDGMSTLLKNEERTNGKTA